MLTDSQELPVHLSQADLNLDEIKDMVGRSPKAERPMLYRSARVIWSIYCSDPARSRRDLSDDLMVTTERIRQIEIGALDRMRDPARRQIVARLVEPTTRLYHAIVYGLMGRQETK